MSEDQSDQILQNYIERILALQAQRKHFLTPEDLKTIACDLGLTEADLAAAEEATKAHLERGLGYCRYGRWSDAIEELNHAASLEPANLSVLHGLATAFKGRWLAEGNEEDRTESIRYAKQCIEVNPHYEPAFSLLSELDQVPSRWMRIFKKFHIWIVVGILGTLIVVGVILLESPLKYKTSLPVRNSEKGSTETDEVDIPVQLVETEKSKGLKVLTRRSTLGQNGFYQLSADLATERRSEILSLKMKIEFLDEFYQVIGAESFDVIHSFIPPLRPGDFVGIRKMADFNNRHLGKVRFSVQFLEEEPIAGTFEPSKIVPLEWVHGQPSNINIEVRERGSSVDTYPSTASYHNFTLEVHNVGQVSVKKLKLEIRRFNAQKKLVSSQELEIIGDYDLSLLPGQTRVRQFRYATSLAFDYYTIAVLVVE